MTKEQNPQAAALRLQNLSGQLKRAYQRAGDHIADLLTPIEEAVAEIDEPWLPKHFAEALKSDDPRKAHRPRSCFASETFANGDRADYVLCVGRKHNRRCGLHVSYCQYAVKPAKDPGSRSQSEVSIRESFVVLPDKLPVPMRLKILDILDAFSEEYEDHVREARGDILDRFGQDSPFEGAALTPTDAETSREPTGPKKGRIRRPDSANGKAERASGEPSQDDETVLEETETPDAEKVREDVPAPFTNSAPVERPDDETDRKASALDPKEDSPAPKAELKNDRTERKGKDGKRTRSHGVRSARLEEAESKIPLKAWI